MDFLKKFFSFKAPASSSPSDASQPSDEGETYIRMSFLSIAIFTFAYEVIQSLVKYSRLI